MLAMVVWVEDPRFTGWLKSMDFLQHKSTENKSCKRECKVCITNLDVFSLVKGSQA
jgi:hypothetical protein